jgi:regulator of RNase E activity RraA
MFRIRPMPPQVPAALLAKAERVEPATIGHLRLSGFPRHNIKPIAPTKRIVGTAVTLTLPATDAALLHHAAGLVRAGDVLVIDRLGDQRFACLGGVVAATLARTGLAAVILDGLCTDPAELRGSGLPIWACGTTALTTRMQGIGGAMNYPVSIGGAVVLPGDLVIADEAGMVFLTLDEAAEEDIDRALALQEAEPGQLAQISEGRPLGELSGASALVRMKLADV